MKEYKIFTIFTFLSLLLLLVFPGTLMQIILFIILLIFVFDLKDVRKFWINPKVKFGIGVLLLLPFILEMLLLFVTVILNPEIELSSRIFLEIRDRLVSSFATGAFEEMIFSFCFYVIIYSLLEKKKTERFKQNTYILFTCILFTVIHINNAIFVFEYQNSIDNIFLWVISHQVVIFLTGLYFRRIYLVTRNIYMAILLHFVIGISRNLHSIYSISGEKTMITSDILVYMIGSGLIFLVANIVLTLFLKIDHNT